MPLTDSVCKNAKAKPSAYKLSDGHGLYLELTPTGAKYWRMKYRFLGKEKRLAFGVYPEVTLAKARERREEARKLLADGIDPAQIKKEQKRLILLDAENTFEIVAREWHAHSIEKWSKSHGDTIIHRLEMDIFPIIGKRPIKEITPLELLSAIQTIEQRGAHEMAHRALQMCAQLMRYAVIMGKIERNVALDIKGALKPKKQTHYKSLDPKRLPALLDALERNEQRLYAHTRLALKIMILTFVRTGELIGAKWQEIDWQNKIWLIPEARMKMKKAHLVPLSTQSLDILDQLRRLSGNSEFIFPSQIRAHKHMSNNTILKAIERLGFKEETTGHGFRALAMSTIKERLGYRHEVIDRQLAHAHKSKIDAAYDRAQFLDERKTMMQEWGNYIDEQSRL